MASTWGVSGTTATYKNDAGKVVATIKGLKSGLTPSIVTSHIRVTEGEGGAAGTLTLDTSVLGTSKVTLTLSNGGKYALALDETVDKVQIQNPALSYASGKATVKGNLTAGYTLTNTKTITHSEAKTNQTLATVSNLATDLEMKDGVIVKKEAEGGGSSVASSDEGETPTAVISLGTDDNAGKILVARDALTTKSATLKLDYAYSGYQIALDGAATGFAPAIDGEWSYGSNKAIYKGKVTTAGYALSADGKTVTYFAENANDKALVTVSGVGSKEGLTLESQQNFNYPFKITLDNAALTSKNVTVTGAGYQLALAAADTEADTPGVLQEKTAGNTWSMNKTTATYKRVYLPYYTLADNKVTYHAPEDIRTFATVSGVKSGLVVSDDGSYVNTSEGTETAIHLDGESLTTIQIFGGALNGKKVTLKNGTDEEGKDYTYKLALNDVAAPGTESEAWKVSGTTATLTGKIKTAGYALTDDNTITYAGKSSKAVTLATVKGLAKNLKLNSDKSAIGTNATVESESTVVEGLSEAGGTITLSKNVLGTTNVELTSSSGFNYSLALNTDGKAEETDTGDVVMAVPTSAANRTFWETTSSTVELKNGKAAYYTATNKNTITYNKPVPGDSIATITGLSTKLAVNDDASEIDGIEFNPENAKQLLLAKKAFNKEDVEIFGSGKYVLGFQEDYTPQDTVGWQIENNVAYLKAYKSEGYTPSNGSKTLTYSERADDNSKTGLPEITGLKKGLTVKSDGSINGIEVGKMVDPSELEEDGESLVTGNSEEEEPELVFVEDASGTVIQLGKNVLAKKDVTINAGSKYTFTLDKDVTVSSSTSGAWDVPSKGKATYKVTTKAGYALADGGSTVAYSKGGKVTATITGLADSLKKDDIEGVLELQEDGKTIAVDSTAVGTKGVVTISGGNYVLARGDGMNTPTISPDHWEITDKKNVGKAELYAKVDVEGYTLSADSKTLTFVEKPKSPSASVANSDEGDDEETSNPIVLTTINGLKGGLKVGGTGINGITGIKVNSGGTILTLSSDVLGTSKVTITGGEYKLALDSNVKREAEEAEDWVTSGTTATYKKYKAGYYTPDETGSSIAYTAATKGTTFATIKGIASGANLNNSYNTLTKTVKLTVDQLGATNVTLTGSSGYKLALDSAVTTADTAEPVQEWVTSGTKANFKQYTPGYYTVGSNSTKITYTAATKGSTLATVSGIKSGVDINGNGNKTSKIVTLSPDMLDAKKVTVSGDGYTLALSNGVTQSTDKAKYWETKSTTSKGTTTVTATYNQTLSKGYAVASDSKSITYLANDKTTTLATIKGLAEGAHQPAVEDEDSPYNGKNIAETISGIEVDNDEKVITFTGEDAKTLIAEGKTATITGGTYTLAVDSGITAGEDPDSEAWEVNKSKGTAARTVTMKDGLSLSADAKSVKSIASDTKTLFTVSGLNTTALKTVTYNTDEDGKLLNTAENILGFEVDRRENTITLSKQAEPFITKKASLGKNDDYTFAFNGITEPTEYSNPKWFVSTVKSTTTAALKDGIEAGYTLSEDEKSVSLTAEQVGEARFTITGLKKGIAVSADRQTIGIKAKSGSITNGITYTSSKVALSKELFGTSTVAIDGGGYSFEAVSGIAPSVEKPTWTLKNGTATYANKQNAGFTLSGDSKTFTYTKASSTTLATVTGLNKNYSGVDLNKDAAPIDVSSKNVIELGAALLGTSKISVTVPKNSAAYTLKLDGKVPEQANAATGWVTSGSTASYKDYTQPYYTVAANGKSVTYNKAKDVKIYATVKGIRSGATITDTDKVITLTDAQLANKDVSLTAGANLGYSLKLDENVLTEPATEESTEWVTSGTTATYKTYKKGGYSINAKGVVKYAKGTNGTGIATIKGVTADISAGEPDGGVFTVSGDELANKITVTGGENGFTFTDYNNASITGSAKADTLTSNGMGLWFSTAAGDDVVSVSGSDVTVISGDGKDSIIASGESAVLNLGAGDDTAEVKGNNSSINGGAGNDIITASGTGISVLAGAGNDAITSSGANAVLDLGAGDDSVEVSGNNSSVSGGAGKDTIVVSGTGISVLAGAGDDAIEASTLGGNEFFFAKDQGNDTISGFQPNDAIQVTSGTASASIKGSDIVIGIGKGRVTLEGAGGFGTININGNEVTPIPEPVDSTNILLADDNYSADAANLSDIVQPFAATYTPYDFNTSLGLTKEDYTPEISFAKDDK